MAAAPESGVKVFAQVQTVAQSAVAASAGVDVIVAQGTEARGHTGLTGTLALVPAVLEAADKIRWPRLVGSLMGEGSGLF